ncbi:hypothetical protein C1T17_07880 [Sphingobium sp. SCG-1]|nr:hypothetical protein C1T17_07880 [Sphingobium sp. SCG-1]
MKMKLVNNCDITMLDVSSPLFVKNDGTMLNSANSNAPSDKRCHLFDANGGGLAPALPVADAMTTGEPSIAGAYVPGHAAFRVRQISGVGTDGGSSTTSELVVMRNYVKRETCIAYNELSGADNPGGEPPAVLASNSSGSFVNGSMFSTAAMSDPAINGRDSFCTKDGNNYLTYFTVITQ